MEAGSHRDLLPIVDNAPPTRVVRSHWRGVLLHMVRLSIVALIVWLIREQHREFLLEKSTEPTAPIEIERLRKFYADATSTAGDASQQGATTVLDESGEALGYFVRTSPHSDHIVGYSGPTHSLIAFDLDSRVLGIEILDSSDTPEHVADVLRNDLFMTALVGKTWSEVKSSTNMDAVSGATLTSLAITEGINFRLGGHQPSLKFPNEVTVAEVVEFFPNASSIRPRASSATILDVQDANGSLLGAVTRSSPATDKELGYQGPTDTLIAFDVDDRVVGFQVRSSYDNEPYVGYVRDEAYFREKFIGRTVDELAKIDIEAIRVEGVSGATMTSMAVAYGLPQAAQAALELPEVAERRFVVASRDIGTVIVIVTAIVMCFSSLRGNRVARITFQIVLIGYFGFVNGDLLSQALLVGWAQSGVPWRLAPGLLLMVAASLVVPAVSKKQLYCHHVCPFGAAQQLIRGRARWPANVAPKLKALLEQIPVILIVVVVLTAMLHWPLNLAGIEPFDAFLFLNVIGIASIVIAIFGLFASALVPMAYCRFGCPTGALLGYLRYNARSDRFTRRDLTAIALLVLAVGIRMFA